MTVIVTVMGVLAGIGTMGALALAIVIYEMAKINRRDQVELSSTREVLIATQHDNEQLTTAVEALQDELAREREARTIEPPEHSDDPVTTLRNALNRLSSLSAPAASEDGDD